MMRPFLKPGALAAALLCSMSMASAARADLPRLRISDNKRFIVQANGTPFFYLGDTAWELFHRLNREEADRYLQDRAAKHFTAIQAVVLAELNGLNDPNAYGQTPLLNNDPTTPNPKYFEHVDYVVKKAESLGLYISMLPTWADKVGNKDEQGRGNTIFTPANARVYGEFLGRRYKNSPIIWVLGGDRNPDSADKQAVWNAMAEGIKAGDGGTHLMTFHPTGGASSSQWFHHSPWLDFNMWQTGHGTDYPVWNQIREDYQRQPVKPVLDGEPLYEDHPIAFDRDRFGTSQAADIRHIAYITVFAGACGYTYGNHSIWQMYKPGKGPINGPRNFWYDALNRPGARQMQYLRALIESRPVLNRIPDLSLLADGPSSGLKRLEATRASDGSYAFIYTSSSRPIKVQLDKLAGTRLRAWWFDPRNGSAIRIGEFAKGQQTTRTWTPPNEGENQDWVLVIDNAAARFGAPGARVSSPRR